MMKKVLFTTVLLLCLSNVASFSQDFLEKAITKALSKVKEKDQIAASNNIKGQVVRLYVLKDKTEAQVWLCDSLGNRITKPKSFYKATGEINGMKIIEYGGLKYIFEVVDKNDYSGIQGFPELFRYNPHLSLVGTLNLPDAIVINKGYFNGSNIERLVLSPNLKKIGEMAFHRCRKLTEIIFPKGCSDITIDRYAFSGCNNLEKIVFPEGCTNITIKDNAFEGCDNLTKVIVPKGKISEFANLMQLKESIFDDGSPGLEYSIEMEKPSTILEKLPLDKLKEISSLKIVGILDENDFAIIRDCSQLKYLDLSHVYTTLSEKEQSSRKANKDFLLGMLQALGEVSEEKYKNGEITTSENLEVQLFAQLAKDESNVKSASVGCVIPWNALKGLSNLETVILPYRAITIENYAFKDCINLRSVQLPKYIESICKGAFENCKNLNDIIIPPTLSSCHYEAFDGCKSLTKLDFSKCTFSSKDGYCTYRGCESLKEIRLPEGIENLYSSNSKSGVVYYMPKTIVKFESTIDNSVIHFKGDNPPKVKSLDYSYKPRKCEIYVPKGCMTKYYATFNGDGNTLKEE